MRSKRALLISIVLAALAVILMYVFIQKKVSIYTGQYKAQPVVVAAKDIPQNTILNESMLEFKMIPLPYIEPNALNSKDRAVEYIAAITMREGEQITDQKLLRPGEKISSWVPKGKRAFTIAINEITGVAGLIRPRDRVDIIGIFRTLDERTKLAGNAEAATLFQNVEVLSVGRNYTIESIQMSKDEKERGSSGGGEVNFSNITLLLTPREAMDLALAQELGNITLTLRPRFDDDPPKINPDLKNDRSTPSSATGIKEKMDISPGPKWLEQRGEKSFWAR